MDNTAITAEIIRLKDTTDLTWQEIANQVGLSREQARNHYRYRPHGHSTVPVTRSSFTQTPPITSTLSDAANAEAVAVFLDKKQAERPDWRELVSLAQTTQNMHARLDDTQRTTEIQIDTDKPVDVVFSGDWHLGDLATDYASWLSNMRYVLDTPGTFLIDLGDSVQNMRTFKSLAAVLNQALSPKLQAVLLRGVIDELTERGKLLAKVRGNHDAFDERIFGEALQAYLLSKMRAPCFDNRGLVRLKVGTQTYAVLLVHQSRYSSIFRPTHGAFRELQLSYPADIITTAHTHKWGFEAFDYYDLAQESRAGFGGLTYLIRVGAFQDGAYGWRFWGGARPVSPVVTLWPNEHRMGIRFRLQE